MCGRLRGILHGATPQRADAGAPLRVHLIGGAGSGKTTLATTLARRIDVPLYSLDDINFADGFHRPRPQGRRLAEVERIACEPAWVTEGIFVGWTNALLEAATLIVWLDLPLHVALGRIVLRHIRASLAGANPYPGLLRLLSFMRWSAAYYRRMSPAAIDALDEESLHSRAATARHLAPYRQKLIRVCNPAEVADLRACLAGLAAATRSSS